ncbi:Sedlin [Xylaria intraflava]|nr:Sedlin [Xylaria intraflava]
MANTIPSIACLGVIGRNNNPLHITIFPSYNAATQSYAPARTSLQFSLLLSGTLDIFESRSRSAATAGGPGGGSMLLSGDFGLLHAIDERLAAYGFETNTGVKFVAVVDMRGQVIAPKNAVAGGRGATAAGGAGVGLRDHELKPIFRAMQTAYVRLLQNPFYDPDETIVPGGGAKRITSRKFGDEMRRIGEGWAPGVTSL